jgi:hypothetical protein
MGEVRAIEDRIIEAEMRWQGYQFRRKTANEASSACPFCRQAVTDGFVIFANGGYLCRKCGAVGWIDENDTRKPTQAEINAIQIRQIQRRIEEHEKRLTVLEQMHRCTDHIRYHRQMNDDGYRDYWLGEGMTDTTIDTYRLGACYGCPTDRDRRFSFTIPVINGGKLVNIRHRLIGGDPGDKYRPHMAGLGNTLFNADDVYGEDIRSILIVEGEKKCIIVKQHLGGAVVGTMGKAGFQKPWATRFARFTEVLIALDPDATDRAREMAGWFGDRARIVRLPVKPDDFLVRYGGKIAEFEWFLSLARRMA